jgi:hypothetical protein
MLTRHAQKLPEKRREELRQRREKASAAFQAELERLMEEKGIEDLEELHRRFVATEYAYIPVPGLHRGKPISLELFKRHAARRHPYVYREFLAGLAEVLGLTGEEAEDLGFIYLMGEPRKM